jgi:hypothetical protein
MAIFSWMGGRYSGKPVRQLDNGNWIFEALQHGPRFAAGTELELKPNEVIEMAAAEMPATDGMAELQKGLEAERAAITPVAELLAAAKEQSA